MGGETEGAICINKESLKQGDYHEKFIVSNPLDLSQIKSFSKFRSCAGHDWSGYNVDGRLETERSMKHYVGEKDSVNEVYVYAPFDGTIVKVYEEQSAPDFAVEIRGYHSGEWQFMFGHIYPEDGIEVGAWVEAGQLIGKKPINNHLYEGTEIALIQDKSTEDNENVFVRAPPLDFMTGEVLAEYAARGITPENIIFTKEERDADPCTWGFEPSNTDISLT